MRPRLTTGLPFSQHSLKRMRLLLLMTAKNEAVKSSSVDLGKPLRFWRRIPMFEAEEQVRECIGNLLTPLELWVLPLCLPVVWSL